MEGSFHGGDGLCGSCGKKALNSQIFIFGNLKFVERKYLCAELCYTGYGASVFARKSHNCLSVSGITPLKNGCVKPSRSSQGSGSDV